MLNLTLSEKSYIVELIRKDQREQNLANKFYIDADRLIQYIEGQSFVDIDEETDLCPNCSVYCEERFTDGQCK